MDLTAPGTRFARFAEELVRRHQGTVRGFLVYLGCPESHLDDLVQETFLSVLSSRFEYRGEEATAAFLRKVARHLFLKAMQRERRRPLDLDPEQVEVAWTEFERDDGGESYLVALRACLAGLTGKPREVIRMRYAEGLERTAIGERLGITESGVKAILMRARERLRACVERKLAS